MKTENQIGKKWLVLIAGIAIISLVLNILLWVEINNYKNESWNNSYDNTTRLRCIEQTIRNYYSQDYAQGIKNVDLEKIKLMLRDIGFSCGMIGK